MSESVDRFTSRVENYARYRPGYPVAIVDLLKTECGLTSASIAADVGSGTGKLSEIFLANGNVVIGVEPNAAMRAAAEKIFHDQPLFRSVDGAAEATTLADTSVDLVAAGQAFHWFDPARTRTEWIRILKPGGWAALIWNDRELQTTPFLSDYEQMLVEFGTDYAEVRHDESLPRIEQFFAGNRFVMKGFPNTQSFDFDGLRGRVRSSSYTPEPNHPTFEPMMRQLEEIFDKHQKNGYVNFDYETKVFYGQLSNSS
ncbi:MAG TPA: class I SAM-dependent methyltransferase [Pyrinomonadaceae bacterium]|nr:class I SAM-dependent methyltransferase [Pyrinomonadaceae bacterium]